MSRIAESENAGPEPRPADATARPRRSFPRGFWIFALALCAGATIAWVDTWPGWDDTGITVGAIFATAAACSLARVSPWWIALLVAGPVVIAEIANQPANLVALAIAMAGAWAGFAVRRLIRG
jgi:hypothetical protein